MKARGSGVSYSTEGRSFPTIATTLSAEKTARKLLHQINEFNEIWARSPDTFLGLHVLADVVNRMVDLRAECNKQLHLHSRKD